MLPDALLEFAQPSSCGLFLREEGFVYLDGAVPPGPPDHDRLPLFVPFQERTRPDAEFSADFRGDRHLTLRRHP
jgi:hypothetical protein